MSISASYEELPLRGVGTLHFDGRAICDVRYVIAGQQEMAHPEGLWNVVGRVQPASGASWLVVTAIDVVGANVSIDLKQDGLWWDCTIFDSEGTARPRDRGLYRP